MISDKPSASPADAQADADQLRAALRDLVAVLDSIGGYLTSEQQAVLWRARRLSR